MNLMQPSGEYSLDEVREKFKQWRNSRDRGYRIEVKPFRKHYGKPLPRYTLPILCTVYQKP